MPSSISTFPTEQFLTFIRGNYTDSNKFIVQANNRNTEWIYEIVKICHNAILERSQHPGTKLNSLLVIKDLMQTCQIPCLNLIQVYILPEVYKIAIQKPQQKGERRGSSLFYNLSKSAKIPNVEEIGIKFVALCSQLLYGGAMIKTKKIFQNFELQKKSDYADYFEKYKEYQIWGTPTSPQSLKSFSHRFIQKGRQDFLKNLKAFNINGDYAEYLVTKIVQSLQTEANPLMNNANQPLSLQNELDMRKLLKTCDPLISSPLIQQSLQKIKSCQNFFVRKNYLSLLTDFIKWGDAEAFMRVCQDNSFQKIGIDMYKMIQGKNGLNEGQKIYPQIKGQLEGKRKFYIQYLKSLQIIVNCLQNQKIFTQQTSDIKSVYNLLKNEKKFVFPQNLMAKKIQNQFHLNLQNNYERNIQIMKRFQDSLSSISKNSYRGSKNSMISAVSVLQKNIQNCLDDIQRLCLSEEDLQPRMKRLQNFKNQFQVQYEYLNEKSSILNKSQLQNFLVDGQQIARTINKLEVIYSQYQQKKINFKQFKIKYAKMIQQDSKNSFSLDRHSSLNIKMSKQSGQQVISSYTPEKVKNLSSTNPIFPTQNNNLIKQNQQFVPRTYENGDKFIQPPIQSKGVNHIIKQNNIMSSQNDQINKSANNHHSQLNNSNLPKSSLVSKYDSFSQMLEEEGAKISGLSNKKQKKQEYIGGKLSKISDVIRSSLDQKSSSQRSSLIQRVQAKKRQKQNLSKQQKPQFILRNNNQNHILPNIINNTISDTNPQFILSSPINKNNNLKDGQKVQYFAPPSFRVPQSAERNYLTQFNRTVQTNTFVSPIQENYSMTAQNFILNSMPNTEGKLGLSSKQNGSNLMQEFSPKEIIPNIRGSYQVTNKLQSEKQSPKFYKTDGNFHQIINPKQIDTKSEQNYNQVNKLSQKVEYTGSITSRISQDNSEPFRKQQKKIYKTQLNNYNQIFRVNEQNSNENSQVSYQNKPIQVAQKTKPNQYEYQIQQKSNKLNQSSESNNFRTVMSKKSSNSGKSESKQNSQLGKSKSSKIEKSQQKGQSLIMKEYYNSDKHQYSNVNQDVIKQPENQPANDSYYGIKDIENQVKNSLVPQFKYCFHVNKQYLPSNLNLKTINNNYLQYGIKLGTQNKGSQVNGCGYDHQSYLLSKIRRQYEKQKDSQTKQIQNRVLELKKDSSRLRNQIIYRENQNRTPSSRSKSRRDYQQEVLSFSNSKSSKSSNNSPIALRPSQKQSKFSAFSSAVVPGVQIHDNSFERYLVDLNKQRLKKCCIKNKSLLLKNQTCQLGYMFCHSQNSTKIILYFTPYYNVSNFSYSISKDPNLDIFCQSKGYPTIPSNKQIKLQIIGIIKNIPYHLPLINIAFLKGFQQKNFSFYLPMTFNKFVQFNEFNPNGIERQLLDPQKILRTSQFQLNPKVVKSQNLIEYFPNLQLVHDDPKNRTTKYAMKCTYKNNNLSLFLISNGSKKMIIQGVADKQPIPLQFLMSTIKKIFEKQR